MKNSEAGCASIPIAIAGWFWSGFVTMTLWRWYIVPATGFPEIPYYIALGVELAVASLVVPPYPPEADDGVKIMSRVIARSWFLPALLLLFGWAIRVVAT